MARPGDDPDTPSKLVEAVVNKSSNMMVCSHHKPLTLEQRSEMGGQANFSLIPKVQDKTELGKDMAAVTEKEVVTRNSKIGARGMDTTLGRIYSFLSPQWRPEKPIFGG